MGIYGALSTAVTGLRAQSFALENISGNIANSQTTGFKRVDTDFLDLIPDAPRQIQTSGSVLAQSRATNTQQGDVKSVSNSTYMAVNGSGFFVVEPAIGQSDGAAVFGGANYYTRRGDFTIDKSGYLVNGSGYYLKGMPIDPATGNISSSLPQVLRVSNSFLPASPTTRVNYQLNLPQLPKNNQYTESKASGSELMDPTGFMYIAPDTPAVTHGAATNASLSGDTTAFAVGAAATGSNPSTSLAGAAETLSLTIGGVAHTYTFAAAGATAGTTISTADASTDTVAEVLSYIQSNLQANGNPTATVGLVDGKIRVSSGDTTSSVVVADGTAGFGLTNGTTTPTLVTGDSAVRLAKNGDSFSVTVGSSTRTYTFSNSGGSTGTAIDLTDPATDTVGEVLSYIKNDLNTHGSATAQVSLLDGQVHISAGNTTDSVTTADNTVGFGVGSKTVTAAMTNADPSTRLAAAGQTLEVKIGTTDQTYTFAMGGGTSGTTIDLSDPTTSNVADPRLHPGRPAGARRDWRDGGAEQRRDRGQGGPRQRYRSGVDD